VWGTEKKRKKSKGKNKRKRNIANAWGTEKGDPKQKHAKFFGLTLGGVFTKNWKNFTPQKGGEGIETWGGVSVIEKTKPT